ncbi:MAG: flagellar basal body L-ring protein FlgH [Alphaproteobacteria bacterium]
MPASALRLAATTTLGLALAGCGAADRLANVGATPELTPIVNPVSQVSYQPVNMPMPLPEPVINNPNSLWQTGARAFFKDQRASRVGDILTVTIQISDQAELNNRSKRTRNASEDSSIDGLLGYENSLGAILPDSVDPGNILDLSSDSESDGLGNIKRAENVDLVVAAVVTQVLPNGNLVIHGSQEVRVNYEVRELYIEGVVRPEDISSSNQVRHDQIAEARIAYGGRGQITDVQQPRYGQQVLDIIYPF